MTNPANPQFTCARCYSDSDGKTIRGTGTIAEGVRLLLAIIAGGMAVVAADRAVTVPLLILAWMFNYVGRQPPDRMCETCGSTELVPRGSVRGIAIFEEVKRLHSR